MKKACAGRCKVFGEAHPETLAAMENLAAVYAKLGDTQTAEELRAKAEEARRRQIG